MISKTRTDMQNHGDYGMAQGEGEQEVRELNAERS
jgi:hypothetical protein